MPGGLISIVVLGKKDKKGSCCPACSAESEAKAIRRPSVGSVRKKV